MKDDKIFNKKDLFFFSIESLDLRAVLVSCWEENFYLLFEFQCVKIYYASLHSFHLWFRFYIFFIYLAYKCIISVSKIFIYIYYFFLEKWWAIYWQRLLLIMVKMYCLGILISLYLIFLKYLTKYKHCIKINYLFTESMFDFSSLFHEKLLFDVFKNFFYFFNFKNLYSFLIFNY